MLGLGLGFRSEICKLRICDFTIAQRILQVAQIDESRAAPALCYFVVLSVLRLG